MKRNIIVLLVLATTLTVLFANSITIHKESMNNLSDHVLAEKIKELFEKDLPLDAKPYLEEAKDRAFANQDTRSMLKWLNYERLFNMRHESDDTAKVALRAALANAWSPLKQMVNLDLLFLERDVDEGRLDAVFDNSDGKLTSLSAAEVTDTTGFICSLSVCDVIGLKMYVNDMLTYRSAMRWLNLVETAGLSQSTAMALSVCLLSDFEELNDSDNVSYERLRELCTTPATKALYSLIDGERIIRNMEERSEKLSEEALLTANDSIKQVCSNFKKVIETYPRSPLAKAIKQKVKTINGRFLSVTFERTAIPDRAVPMLIKHRNVDTVAIVVRKAATNTIVDKTTLRLPKARNMMQTTSTYNELKPLPVGEYVVECVVDEVVRERQALVVTKMNVSKFSLNDGLSTYCVVDALTGKPLEGIVFRHKMKNTILGNSDSMGYVSFKDNDKTYNRKEILVENADDRVSLSVYTEFERSLNYKKLNSFATIVCDRNVYRPGQSLMFKVYGYLSSYINSVSMTSADKLKVSLITSDGKTVYDDVLTLNDFGTADGVIELPDDVQKGFATLQVSYNNRYLAGYTINISDYKRTNNTISFAPVTSPYVCGDTVILTGSCMSADMTPVANAQVKWIANCDEVEGPLNGTTYTDDNGEFAFQIATPQKESCFITVNVDITDTKGETTEGGKTLHLSDTPFKVSVTSDEQFVERDSISLVLGSTNFDDCPYESNVDISVSRRDATGSFKPVCRFANNATIDNSMVETPIVRLDDKDTEGVDYRLTEVVPTRSYTISDKTDVLLGDDLPAGSYVAKVSYSTPDGTVQTMEHKFNILPADSRKCAIAKPLAFVAPESVVVGKPFSVRVGSRYDDAKARVMIICNNKLVLHRIVDCTSNMEELTFAIDSADVLPSLDDIKIIATLVSDNRTYAMTKSCAIEQPSRRIDVRLTTWRNMTSPKADEQWTVRINNDKPTELLATMYDTRLDKLWRKVNRPSFYSQRLSSGGSFNEPNLILNPTKAPKRFDSSHYRQSGKEIINLFINENECFAFQRYHLNERDMVYFALGSPRLMNKAIAYRGAVSESDVEECAVEDEASSDDATDNGGFNFELRSDFRETVFFYPSLMPDSSGVCSFGFKVPDNLTTYRLRLLAHDTSLKVGYKEETLTVQKQLAVKSGVPRFVREGDEIEVTAEVRANSSEITEVQCLMIVTDTVTGELVDEHKIHTLTFDSLHRTASTKWRLLGVEGTRALRVAISAKCDTHTDGEVNIVEVLPSTVNVEESYPFVLYDAGKHSVATPDSATEHVGKWCFNYASNTFMEVLKALPHLNKERYPSADTYLGCVETNAIAAYLRERHDVDKAVKALRENAELSSTPLKGTFFDGRNSDIERHIAKVVGMLKNNNAERECQKALRKLSALQKANGGIPWCKGMDESDFMTAGVVEMLSWLVKYGLLDGGDPLVSKICKKGAGYLDSRLLEMTDDKTSKPLLGHTSLYMAYSRCLVGALPKAVKDSLMTLNDSWRDLSVQQRIMLSTIMWRNGEQETARTMLRSISQNLVVDEHTAHLSMRGYSWWENDIYMQSMLILLMNEIAPDDVNGKRLTNWLMLQKRTEHWGNSQSTSRAVMALISVSADNSSTDIVTLDDKQYTLTVDAPSMSTQFVVTPEKKSFVATIEKERSVLSWGSWTSFSHTLIVELQEHNTDEMSITRALQVERNGEFVDLDTAALHVGDKVRITLTVKCDMAMDYVRISDYRASVFEPVDQLSEYHWRWRLGRGRFFTPYFYSPSDTDVTFLCEHLSRGTHTFSYDVYVTNEGVMTGGYCEAESLYCRDFSIHTGGATLRVAK